VRGRSSKFRGTYLVLFKTHLGQGRTKAIRSDRWAEATIQLSNRLVVSQLVQTLVLPSDIKGSAVNHDGQWTYATYVPTHEWRSHRAHGF
jgi:hypothetical protein